MKSILKGSAAIVAAVLVSGTVSAAVRESIDFALVDSFKAMRECKEGVKISGELDALRDKLSKEIQDEAQRITKDETDLKSKAATIKPDVLAKRERDLAKQKRALEEKVGESEQEIKLVMQQKTEELAVKVEEGIVAVAKRMDVDAVIDKMTGRVMYTKDDKKGDITVEAIDFVDKKSTTVASSANAPRANAAG